MDARQGGNPPLFNLITSRRLSLLIVLAYAAVVFVGASQRSAIAAVGAVLATLMYFLLPLACIWFGDEMGDYIGTVPGPAINRRSPGWMVKVGGWFFLFLPIIVVFIARISEP